MVTDTQLSDGSRKRAMPTTRQRLVFEDQLSLSRSANTMHQPQPTQAQGPQTDLALHTLGWKAFQDLCAVVCSEVLGKTVSVYREAQDGGQDAVFLLANEEGDRTAVEGTVQCKFSSKANQRLRVSDINLELDTVSELVAAGKASSYSFITSMGVDAPVAAEIRKILISRGVKEAQVHGKEWLTLHIRGSARLRALVPRVYGLGDLSIILDERCATQTRALLGHLMPALRVYVPTTAHRSAVRVLGEHGIVLLLGPPASGKSTLAAILATTAIDGDHHQCLKCESPIELIERWNPDEKGRLYWIDDAFGPNQLKSDFVDSWIGIMPKVKAALEVGSRFLLTSRTHIWKAAKPKLGTRNHPLLESEKAVVDVGNLGPEEKIQIIYNHIKAGNQTTQWKQLAKPHLSAIASSPSLLPEFARRLGDKNFTRGIRPTLMDLTKFIEKPEDFLKQTITELNDPHQAALALVFLRQSRLEDGAMNGQDARLVADKYGTTVSAMAEALRQLDGTFLAQRQDQKRYWIFQHPTFTDAISSILSKRPDLVDLYVRGTRIETLLSDATCDGSKPIRNAVIIPMDCFDALVNRILSAPIGNEVNKALFDFLVARAPDDVCRRVLEENPRILERASPHYWHVAWSSRIQLIGRAFRLGLLPATIRAEAAQILEDAAIFNFDASFIDDPDMLGLLEPVQLLRLGSRLVEKLRTGIPQEIKNLIESADPNSDVPDQFDHVTSFVRDVKSALDLDPELEFELDSINDAIEEAINEVHKRKRDDEDAEDWNDVSPAKVSAASDYRSVFSDVDD
jgi:hypothetical protein